MHRVSWRIIGVSVALCCAAPVLRGEDGAVAPAPSQEHDRLEQLLGRYGLYPAFGKLGRGLANILLGWLEIPVTIEKRYVEDDAAASLCAGAIEGLFKGVVRTGVGVYESVTFLLPYPEEFAPVLPTLDYATRKPSRESRRAPDGTGTGS